MNSEFKNYMEEYERVQEEIKIKEEALHSLKQKMATLKKEVKSDVKVLKNFGKDKFIYVNLGDILKEISKVKNIPLENFKVNAYFSSVNSGGRNGAYFKHDLSKDDFLKFNEGILNILITDKFDNFDTEFAFNCFLNDVQADNRTLLEHMVLKKYESEIDYDYFISNISYSSLVLDESYAEFINCRFSLNQIMSYQNSSDVFSYAVLNAMNKQKEKVLVK